MCRYAEYGPYKDHLACFRCRKAFKRREACGPAICPDCGSPMHDMGLDFAPPPRRDVEHWAVVEILSARGFTYQSCGCDGPGFRPTRMRDVLSFLLANEQRSEGSALAEKFARRAHPAPRR